jgi:protein-L-isoaspartate(D-aspartate) O-methyltransferase
MARHVDYRGQRARMVNSQLAERGIHDPRVLEAFARVPREEFVPAALAPFAYDDAPLPIGDGQTISQPYIVAFTVDALQLNPHDRVLDIGTGSGYAAAVLAELSSEVYSVERVGTLCHSARERLRRLHYDNVHVRCGDGSLGWADHAPYAAIAVAAVGPRPPPALLSQLEIGGRLVMPIGPSGSQTLVRMTRRGRAAYKKERLVDVRFVPLIGAQGFDLQSLPPEP